MTKQRALIKSIIQNSMSHLNAQEIYLLAKEQMPTIAMATVYNNINVLSDMSIIRRIKVKGNVDLYDGNVVPHGHLICEHCGHISDMEMTVGVSEYLSQKYDVNVLSYELNATYLCSRCKDSELSQKCS